MLRLTLVGSLVGRWPLHQLRLWTLCWFVFGAVWSATTMLGLLHGRLLLMHNLLRC